MVAEPAVTPATKPEVEFVPVTVALPVDELQVPVVAGVPDPVSVVLDPTQTVVVPFIVGTALTVTVTALLNPVNAQPFASVTEVSVYVVVDAGVTLKLDPVV